MADEGQITQAVLAKVRPMLVGLDAASFAPSLPFPPRNLGELFVLIQALDRELASAVADATQGALAELVYVHLYDVVAPAARAVEIRS